MKFNPSFNFGPFIETRESDNKSFLVELGEYYLGDFSSPRFLLDVIINGDCTYGFFRHWRTDWFINVYDYDPDYGIRLIKHHKYNESNRNVAIILESDDLYENRIWIDKCIEYQKKTNAIVFVFTKFFNFFEKIKQNNIKICPPDAFFKDPIHKTAYNIEREKPLDLPDLSSKEFTWKDKEGYYASYKIGRFPIKENGLDMFGHHLQQDQGLIREHWWRQYESYKNPINWENLTSEQIADHILGLDPLSLEEELQSLKSYKYLDI